MRRSVIYGGAFSAFAICLFAGGVASHREFRQKLSERLLMPPLDKLFVGCDAAVHASVTAVDFRFDGGTPYHEVAFSVQAYLWGQGPSTLMARLLGGPMPCDRILLTPMGMGYPIFNIGDEVVAFLKEGKRNNPVLGAFWIFDGCVYDRRGFPVGGGQPRDLVSLVHCPPREEMLQRIFGPVCLRAEQSDRSEGLPPSANAPFLRLDDLCRTMKELARGEPIRSLRACVINPVPVLSSYSSPESKE